MRIGILYLQRFKERIPNLQIYISIKIIFILLTVKRLLLLL